MRRPLSVLLLAVGLTGLLGFTGDPGSSTPRTSGGELERLGAELMDLLERYRWRSARWGVLVVSLDQGDTLFAREPDALMAPASNMKLLTSVGALHTLGAEYRFRTYLVSDGWVEDGVLHGDLALYGTGDPGLSDRFYPSRTWVFEKLAAQLREAGIERVSGDLVADASFLPGPLRPGGWDPRDLNDHFAPGISALSFNENVVSFRVAPASRIGRPPQVHTLPDHAGLPVENGAITVSDGARSRVSITRDEPLAPFVVQGRIGRRSRDVWRQMTVPVPARFAGSVFRAVLEERGVDILGDLRVVDIPARSMVGGEEITAPVKEGRRRTRILARHESPPLRDYLAVVNKQSNNLFAELLLRTMGRQRTGVGTSEAGARVVKDALVDLGVDPTGLVQLDGSGLSEGNRVSPGIFVDLLRRESASSLWPEFWASLPEAGRRRELPRMYRTAAAGNLRAKTGTIERVSALTGVVRSAQGERLAFSILVNGTPSTSGAKRVENAIGARLASFTRGMRLPTRTAELTAEEPAAESGGPVRHRVQRGENLTTIARQYGVTLEAVRDANPGVDPSRLQAGGLVLIPPAPSTASGGSGGGLQ